MAAASALGVGAFCWLSCLSLDQYESFPCPLSRECPAGYAPVGADLDCRCERVGMGGAGGNGGSGNSGNMGGSGNSGNMGGSGGVAAKCVSPSDCGEAPPCSVYDCNNGVCVEKDENVVCGDGKRCGLEVCDDGNFINCDGCRADCSDEETGCGDGFVCGSEACDDGNGISGDGCDANCKLTGCGNGVKTGAEACDDGNTANCDGCRGDCSAQETGCGDGFVCGAEQCDDGNLASGDGCEPNCTPCGAGPVSALTQSGFAPWAIPNYEAGLPNPASLTDLGNGTVKDNVTGLVWQKALDASSYTWQNAKTYCDNLVLAGCSDWRLPSRMELLSIVDRTKVNPAIDTSKFPGTPGYYFWSSSPVAGNASVAWGVLFNGGSAYYGNDVSNTYRVRCVR
jgi:cysteine-rich repeat protein